jgi:hypothetical protein
MDLIFQCSSTRNMSFNSTILHRLFSLCYLSIIFNLSVAEFDSLLCKLIHKINVYLLHQNKFNWIAIYSEVLTFALRFTAIGAPPDARRIRILPMNQHAWWLITFGIMGNKFMDRLTALCFKASSAVHGWEFSYELSVVGGSYQLHYPFDLYYNSWAVCYVTLRYTVKQRVFLYDTYVKYWSARKCRWKFQRKFRDERVFSTHTIHNLVNKLRSTGLLIDNKQKYKRRVPTEAELDDTGVRFVCTPRKSLKRLAEETGVS